MSIKITAEEYFGQYQDHPDATERVRENAEVLLAKVNVIYTRANLDGCEMPDNPKTGSGVGGDGHGGFRPQDCKVGAPNSTHKTGEGIDRFDPHRKFASWCMAHQDILKAIGLHMEDVRWTVTLSEKKEIVGGWVHLQSVPPKSGNVVYIPSLDPPLAQAPLDWSHYA
jgi:hypothetical protein